jgi:hypothetical protein
MGLITGNLNGNASNAERTGKVIKSRIYLLGEDQLDKDVAFPERVNREYSTLPLLAGEYWHYLDTVSINNPELTLGGSLSDAGAVLSNSLRVVCGGISSDILDFVEKYVGRGVYVVIDNCATGDKYLLGNGCSPAILQAPEGGSKKDGTNIALTFLNECGELISIFTGTLALQAAVQLVPAASVNLVTGNNVYDVLADTDASAIATLASITDSDVNRVLTFKGKGGAQPALIVDTGNFVLIGGEDWEANLGAEISFRIFKDGAATYSIIEVAGSRK